MKKAMETLTEEVKKFMSVALGKCESCESTRKLADHETRIRDLERMVWKAAGAAVIGSTLLTFALTKLFK